MKLAVAILTSVACLCLRGGTNNFPRVAVEAAAAVSATVGADHEVEKATPASETVGADFVAELAKAASNEVERLISEKMAKASREDMPSILAAVFEKVTEENAPAIAAAVYVRLCELLMPALCRVEEIESLKKQWYERMSALPGSKAYWILKIAKEKASRGEDVSKLKAAFDDTINRWLSE